MDNNKSLISSSKALSNISKSFSTLTTSLSSFATTTTKIAKTLNNDNKLKKQTIADDESFFAKRRTAFLRKRKEDQIEATGIRGASKARSSMIKNPATGLLGRILNFFAVTIIGWVTFQLPPILKRFEGLIKNIIKLVGVFNNFIDNISSSFIDFNQNLDLVNTKIGDQIIDEDEYGNQLKETGDKVEIGFLKMGKDFSSLMKVYGNKKTYGLDDKNSPNPEIELSRNKSTDKDPLMDIKTSPITGITTSTTTYSGPTGITTGSSSGPTGITTGSSSSSTEDRDDDIFNPTIANDKKQPLIKRFEAGYTPKKEIEKDGKMIINPEWVEYQEWLNESGFNIDGLAEGGRLDARTLSFVGEEGPELFISDTAGTIVPNKVTVDFIERIIANKNNASVVEQKRAARSLYEKLVENHIAKHGHIRIDEDDKIKSQTIGRLKTVLNNKSSLETKQSIDPQKSLELDTPEINVDRDDLNSILSKIDLPKINIPDLKTERRGPVVVLPSIRGSSTPQQTAVPVQSSTSGSLSGSSKSTEKDMFKHLSTLVTAYT